MTSFNKVRVAALLSGLAIAVVCAFSGRLTPNGINHGPTQSQARKVPAGLPSLSSPEQTNKNAVVARAVQWFVQKYSPDNTALGTRLVQVFEATWPDSCMGMAGEGDICRPGTMHGYRLILQVGGDEHLYEIHTDLEGRVIGTLGALPR